MPYKLMDSVSVLIDFDVHVYVQSALMRATYAIEVLGSGSAVARRAGVTRQAVWNWKENDDLIPELYARRLDGTRGRNNRVLKFDPRTYGLDG